ncbi:unnamed protein product [Parajaminaea phylloscopi]
MASTTDGAGSTVGRKGPRGSQSASGFLPRRAHPIAIVSSASTGAVHASPSHDDGSHLHDAHAGPSSLSSVSSYSSLAGSPRAATAADLLQSHKVKSKNKTRSATRGFSTQARPTGLAREVLAGSEGEAGGTHAPSEAASVSPSTSHSGQSSPTQSFRRERVASSSSRARPPSLLHPRRPASVASLDVDFSGVRQWATGAAGPSAPTEPAVPSKLNGEADPRVARDGEDDQANEVLLSKGTHDPSSASNDDITSEKAEASDTFAVQAEPRAPPRAESALAREESAAEYHDEQDLKGDGQNEAGEQANTSLLRRRRGHRSAADQDWKGAGEEAESGHDEKATCVQDLEGKDKERAETLRLTPWQRQIRADGKRVEAFLHGQTAGGTGSSGASGCTLVVRVDLCWHMHLRFPALEWKQQAQRALLSTSLRLPLGSLGRTLWTRWVMGSAGGVDG